MCQISQCETQDSSDTHRTTESKAKADSGPSLGRTIIGVVLVVAGCPAIAYFARSSYRRSMQRGEQAVDNRGASDDGSKVVDSVWIDLPVSI